MTGAQDTRLRPLQPGDAPAIQRIYSPRAVRFLPRGPMDRTQAAAWLAAHLDHHTDPWRHRTWSITTGDELVGVIRLTRKTPRSAAVSYILREDHWGTGHATRALRAVLPHAFDDLELLVLRARHHPDNAASGRVLERAGFTSLPAGRETIPYIHTRSAWRAATNPWTTLLPG